MEFRERRFEQDIETWLINEGGYIKGDMTTYDKKRAINLPKLIEFIRATQPKKWERYLKNYGDEADSKLYKRFNDTVNTHGLIHVLRQGFDDRGVRIRVAYFKPESTLNEDVIQKYESNILTCTRQFKYSEHNENSIDMVLSLNGIPIVAIELKNQLTGQSIDNGKIQFMYDRSTKETCFKLNRRFLVYFAVDLYEVAMTTELKGDETYFLPFNQGSNGPGNVGGSGNPGNPTGYATAYLWEDVLQKDVLMDMIQRYLHIDKKTVVRLVDGREVRETKKKLIFPRYHQLDVVKKLLSDVKKRGSGKNYLVQHSAGSGKSNSIAWLAYGLSNMHDEDNKPIFTSVIVISDRKVLDGQLQDTISGFDHTIGVVETIGEDKTSQDLLKAINDGKKIIVTTLQKFPVIFEEVDETKGKKFAIIADEAHQSQTGRSAQAVRAALADTEEALREFAEIEGEEEEKYEDNQDKLVKELASHGSHKNLSFFAFTATPKQKTLELFGSKHEEGTFRAHHVYSMRQAIEESFILDVLQNYMTYRTCYKIAKDTADNPEVPTSKAVRTVKRYASLHPHSLQQKTAIIIEQFREITKSKIDGRAKAMVVTASRLHAVRYYHEFKRYLEQKEYDDLEILVAFSGVIKDGGEEYSEEKMNIRGDGSSIKEKQLPAAFNSEDFNMLIVAEKYQTGFDEPLLHSMFVDKKLKGVKAVQTLSRLNRIYPGKKDTFILDFVNTKEEIEEAFKPYYEETILDKEIDVNLIYDTRIKIRNFQLYDDNHINQFIDLYYKVETQTATDLGKMTSNLKPIMNLYKKLTEEDRREFRRTIRNFNKWYSYIIQIARMYDKELHKEHVFLSYLEKVLPREENINLDLEDKLKLEYYKLEQTFKGEITLDPTPDDEILRNPEGITLDLPEDKDSLLEEILNKINENVRGDFNERDRVIASTMYKKAKHNNPSLEASILSNDENAFVDSIFPEFFDKTAIECYNEQVDSFDRLFRDRVYYETMRDIIAKELYREMRNIS